jgi:hypothetical protein
MKNLLLLTALAIICFATSSCQDEGSFSCDPLINEWALENLEIISEMTYSQIAEIPSLEK